MSAVKKNGSKGEKHWCCRLTAESVREIRKLRAKGEKLEWIAATYGVSQGHVWRIANRLNWRHV